MKDDFLLDAFYETHDNDTLADELMSAAKAIAHGVDDLLGASPVEQMVRAADQLNMMGAGSEERDAEIDYADFERVLDDLDVDKTLLPLGYNSLAIQLFAMTGMVMHGDDDPDQSHAIVQNYLAWGRRVQAILPEGAEAPYFQVFLNAARARYALDRGEDVSLDELSSLAAVARWPLDHFVRPEILDVPKKTIQNLLSAGTLARSPDGLIESRSAFQWIKDQAQRGDLFPSMAFLPKEPAQEQAEIEDPVFVPVTRSSAKESRAVFTPAQRHADGYEIYVGASPESVSDYWDALAKLQASENAWFRPRHSQTQLPVDGWERRPRKELEEELADIQQAGTTERSALTVTEQIDRLLRDEGRILVHRKGHTSKLLRYATRTGVEFAVEKRRTAPLVYVADTTELRARLGDMIIDTRAASTTGRNSNLNAITSFKNKPLLVLRPETVGEFEKILEAVLGHAKS